MDNFFEGDNFIRLILVERGNRLEIIFLMIFIRRMRIVMIPLQNDNVILIVLNSFLELKNFDFVLTDFVFEFKDDLLFIFDRLCPIILLVIFWWTTHVMSLQQHQIQIVYLLSLLEYLFLWLDQLFMLFFQFLLHFAVKQLLSMKFTRQLFQ